MFKADGRDGRFRSEYQDVFAGYAGQRAAPGARCGQRPMVAHEEHRRNHSSGAPQRRDGAREQLRRNGSSPIGGSRMEPTGGAYHSGHVGARSHEMPGHAMAGLGQPGAMVPLAALGGNSPPYPQGGDAREKPKGRRVQDNFVNRVLDSCGEAVCRVETEQSVKVPEIEDADLFAFFFGVRPEKGKKERKVRGHGSGFCIDGQNGIILTNAHVVQESDKVSVTFGEGAPPLECEVLETDNVIDLAALRVRDRSRSPLPAVHLGSSDSVKTGDWAIALGSPLGLRNTCTLGIVSSLDRSTGETGFDWMRHPLLQTDAAVNQGNSGGPLLNELGEVIGMISMRAMFGEGIGFAIPVDTISQALSSLVRQLKVPHSYMGFKMTAESPDGEGRHRSAAFVEMVLPQSPADQAGFQAEDQIVEAGGHRVKHFADVQRLVRSSKVGSSLQFKVKRAGKSVTLTATVDDVKNLKKEAAGPGRRAPHGGGQHRIMIVPRSKS